MATFRSGRILMWAELRTERVLWRPIAASLVLWLAVCGAGSGVYAETPARVVAEEPLPKFALKRLGSLRFLPRSDAITRSQYSPDGRYLATSATHDFGTVHPGIQIWERGTGLEVTPLKLRGLDASGFAWGPKEARFITSHPASVATGGLNLWNVGSDGPQRFSDVKPQGYLGVRWARQGNRIAAVSESHEIVVFEGDGRVSKKVPIRKKLTYFHFAAFDLTQDGKKLVSASEAGVEVLDLNTGANELVKVPYQKESYVHVLCLPDGKSMAVGYEPTIEIHKFGATPSLVRKLKTGHIIDMTASPNGKWLATGGPIRAGLRVWNLEMGKLVHKQGEFGSIGSGLAFSPDNSELCVATRRLSFLKTENWKPSMAQSGPTSSLTSVKLIGDRIYTGGNYVPLMEWDLDSAKFLRVVPGIARGTRIFCLLDKNRMAVPQHELSGIDVIDLQTGKVDFSLPGHEDGVSRLVYSPRGRRLYSTGADNALRAWNLIDKREALESPLTWYDRKAMTFFRLALSPDGKLLACSPMSSLVHVIDLSTGTLKFHLDMNGKGASLHAPMAFTPDSKLLVSFIGRPHPEVKTATLEEILLTDCGTGKEVARLPTEKTMHMCMAVSPDSQYLVVAGLPTPELQIWSLVQRKKVAEIPAHFDAIRDLCFSDDGRRLISVSQDTTGLIWDFEAIIRESLAEKKPEH